MKALKTLLFFICLLPVAWLFINAEQLGPDPGKELVLLTGIWALRFLLITLAMTPLRQWSRLNVFIQCRRMLGLYSWFYASLHLFAVMTYMLGWSWDIFVEEFSERPYMAAGILAWLLMLPLGVTSNRFMIKRLGRRWKSLHRLIYPIGIIACVHFVWQVRADYLEALMYTGVLVLLLLYRVVHYLRPSIFVDKSSAV